MNHHLDIECVQRASPSVIVPRATIAPDPGTARPIEQRSADQDDPAPDAADISSVVCQAADSGLDAGRSAEVHRRGADRNEAPDKSAGCSGTGRIGERQGAEQEGPESFSGRVCQNRGETREGRKCEVGGSGSEESPGDFEVMPTLNEWLPSAHTDGGGPIHTAKAAATCEAPERQSEEPVKKRAQKQGASGHIHIDEGNEGEVRGPVPTPGQEPVRTPSPARREAVRTPLGMVRERGQRPLFGLSWAAIQARQPSAPKGHYLVENFLTEQVRRLSGATSFYLHFLVHAFRILSKAKECFLISFST